MDKLRQEDNITEAELLEVYRIANEAVTFVLEPIKRICVIRDCGTLTIYRQEEENAYSLFHLSLCTVKTTFLQIQKVSLWRKLYFLLRPSKKRQWISECEFRRELLHNAQLYLTHLRLCRFFKLLFGLALNYQRTHVIFREWGSHDELDYDFVGDNEEDDDEGNEIDEYPEYDEDNGDDKIDSYSPADDGPDYGPEEF